VTEAVKGGLGSVAIRGSVLNSAQWLLNKLLTAAAMLLIAWFLTPAEYGTGTQALAISAFVFVLPVMTVGDVLIAHPRQQRALAGSAQALAWRLGVITSVLTLAAIPLALWLYPAYPAVWLGGLLAALAIRPLLDARLMLPMTSLRLKMAYPRIAMVEGVVQAGATLAAIAVAAVGGRAAALVAPQIAGTMVRCEWYRRLSPAGHVAPAQRSRIGLLLHHYWRGASAQYLHNILVGLEVLVLGMVCGEIETGLFGLAFTMAIQANGVIAYQLGQILQPIFGHLQDDPVRQVAGFFKAQRVLSAVCIPICCAQAILAEPLFRLAFSEKWQPAIPVFQVVSLMQAFYFATGPSMACLRAQRRFGTFLVWQAVQCVVSVPLYWIGARQGGAVGVAMAAGVVWALSAPVVVWLCTLPAEGGRLGESAAIFARPWVVAVPVFGLAWLGMHTVSAQGWIADLAALVVLGPMTTIAAIWLMRYLHPDIRMTLDGLLRGVMRRIRPRSTV
jgi:PST family polysaccharide transporter